MQKRADQILPRARTRELIVRELPEEVLVYDIEREKAHCLNHTSAFIWKHCDGKRTVKEVALLFEKEFATLIDEDVVWLALNQLHRLHLLEEGDERARMLKVSRRDLVGKYLPAAFALPVILSIATPAAAQAASTCGGNGAACTGGPGQGTCCAGFGCNP